MPGMPQRDFESPEVENLVDRIVEALRFLTIPVEKPARFANAERIENAVSVLSITIGPYEAAIQTMLEHQRVQQIAFDREMSEFTNRKLS